MFNFNSLHLTLKEIRKIKFWAYFFAGIPHRNYTSMRISEFLSRIHYSFSKTQDNFEIPNFKVPKKKHLQIPPHTLIICEL